MEKSKVYNLAVEITQYNKAKTIKHNKQLPKIIEQQGRIQLKEKSINIFTQDQPTKIKIQDIASLKPYSFVGKKQVQLFYHKLSKKKRQSVNKKRSQSIMSKRSISSYKTTSQYNCLTNEDLVNSLINSRTLQKVPDLKKTLRQEYLSNWKNLKKGTKKYQSIYDIVDKYRSRAEELQNYSLHQQKENFHERDFPKLLRCDTQFNNVYEKKYVMKVLRNGLSLKAKNKFNAEITWINQKSGYVFKKLPAIKTMQMQSFKQTILNR